MMLRDAQHLLFLSFFSFKRGYLFILREGEGRKKRGRNIDVREKHQLVASCTHPDWRLNTQPEHVPNWASKQQPFALWEDIEPTEPHQLGLDEVLGVLFERENGLLA